jgi:hypothetical protein
MQTLVIRIPDDLARELEAESKKTHLTKRACIRHHGSPASPSSPKQIISWLPMVAPPSA